MSTAKDRDEAARKRFEGDTTEHQMKVLRDDGLYRHLRFSAPGTWCYGFDLVTWPGYLAIVGDAGDYMFARIRDMFEFFDGDGYRINPQYWAEKLQGPGRDTARSYQEESLRQHVLEWFADKSEELSDDEVHALRAALDEQILNDEWGELHDEAEAHRRLREFEHNGIQIYDSWEWDLREYDGRFLWCCWAILWGIKQYHTANPAKQEIAA